MDPIIGGSLIGGGASILSDLFNMISTGSTNRRNEALMRETWGREDTAVQRRVHDLEAAGLSPVLAAGSAAASSGPIRMEAPQLRGDFAEKAFEVATRKLGLKKLTADIEATNAQKAYIDMQRKGVDLDNTLKTGLMAPKISSATSSAEFLRESYSTRVAMLAEALEGKSLDNINKEVNKRLQEARITSTQVQTELNKVRKTLVGAQVADTVAATIAKASLLSQIAANTDLAKARTKAIEKNLERPIVPTRSGFVPGMFDRVNNLLDEILGKRE